jgi:hypothetical protein
MAEVLIDFEIQLEGPDGRMYGAQVCGRSRPDRLWEGWIEFDPVGGGDPVRTGVETTQPKRHHLLYWATGLTATYLEGALLRTLREFPPLRPRANPAARPFFEGPAERERPTPSFDYQPTAVLDPFRVYASGADMLRNQLNALSRDHLANIVKAYRLSRAPAGTIDGMTREELIALVMKAVETK